MKTRLTFLFITLFTTIPLWAIDYLSLQGNVKDAVTKLDLPQAKVIRYDSLGNPTDTLPGDCMRRMINGESVTKSLYFFPIERKDSTYVFDIICPGYITETVVFNVKDVKKREEYRVVPTVYLKREPHKLGEVTVTASKIKFYNKGDTLVYNADAFQLAEGSMLDALIAQLPGVELSEGGQIKVNGEFVESLLLNGKQFFDGNNQLMLENIGAYTVKTVEVYEGSTRLEKWRNDPTAEKHLTMDVKLKKEYMMGWILNTQAGGGTKDRYMGRLFASWFTPRTNLTLVGNLNNLNDNRKPGKSDTWTPEMMPSGTKIYKMAALNYDHTTVSDNNHYNGYVKIEDTSNNNCTTTARTNFLNGGNTYDNIFSRNRTNDLKAETRNYINIAMGNYYHSNMVLGRYIRKKSGTADISGTFNREQADMTSQALEALYSDGSAERLDAVINRSITRSDGSSREWEVQAFPTLDVKIPGTYRGFRFQIGMKYKENKEERWRDYNINYGADPTPAVVKRQYFDNSPNNRLTLDGYASYNGSIGLISYNIAYSYRFQNTNKDSYMYALDRLADMGIYGTVPAGYLDSFDPDNSYTYRLLENIHSIEPNFQYSMFIREKDHLLSFRFAPEVALHHQHLNYWRAGRNYLVKQSSIVTTVGRYSGRLQYQTGSYKVGRALRFDNDFEYNYNLDTKLPDILHMIDIVNDSDPLNISLGNPDLKCSHIHKHSLKWAYTPHTAHRNNVLELGYEYTKGALVRGYTYDTSTGVRRTRTYNVDGNYRLYAQNSFFMQFGKTDQFTISCPTDINRSNYADMIGVNTSEPVKSTVRNLTFNQGLKLSWNIGRQQISFNGSATLRHTSSTREDFNVIDARHFNYGLLGQFNLPAGFGINTDFTLYTRRGYGSKELDTTDAIWNVRLTYTPRGGRWVFMADGFDLLHQLSNVNYTVNASGRTVRYSNALPRYLLFSAQYRLNIQPKKR